MEDRYRSVVENVVEGIISIDEQGMIESFNPAAELIFGYRAKEVIGRNVSVLMPEPYRREHDGYIGNYVDGGEKKIIGIGREVTGLRKDGTTFPMDLAVGEYADAGGRKFTGVIRDISERKKAEEALRTSEERLRSVFEAAGMVIIVLSPKFEVLEWNREAERVYGFQREEALGVDYVGRFLPAAVRDRVKVEMQQILSGRPARAYENPVTTRDGTERVISWNSDRLTGIHGEPIGLIACGQDVTDYKRLQGQLLQAQKMESIGQLAGGVAHDFNNQLGIILFDVDMLLAAAAEETSLREDLQKIRKVVLRASDLTRQLLVFSRRQRMEPEPMSLNGHIQELQKMLSRLLGEHIEVTIDLAADLDLINADPGNMDQIVINLCVNARDAMPDGGELTVLTRNVTVTDEHCQTHTQASPGQFCRLTITDTGCGMDEETSARIFEPFFTTKEVGKGTGLGLSVVYGIVEGHEGWIEVKSRLGEGTKFDIFLPAIHDEVRATSSQGNAAMADHVGRGERILVIEDNEDLRIRAEKILTETGYSVSACGSLAAARAVWNSKGLGFDLVLTDIVLPDGRGPDFVFELLVEKPGLRCLFVTGYTDERVEWERVNELGFRVLQKPFAPADLLGEVRLALEARR